MYSCSHGVIDRCSASQAPGEPPSIHQPILLAPPDKQLIFPAQLAEFPCPIANAGSQSTGMLMR